MDDWFRKNRILSLGILAVIVLWFVLMITDSRILLSEKKIDPGQSYVVEDYGDLGEASQASLVCLYFNGRKTMTEVFWYSPDNIFGRDSCPFLSQG